MLLVILLSPRRWAPLAAFRGHPRKVLAPYPGPPHTVDFLYNIAQNHDCDFAVPPNRLGVIKERHFLIYGYISNLVQRLTHNDCRINICRIKE